MRRIDGPTVTSQAAKKAAEAKIVRFLLEAAKKHTWLTLEGRRNLFVETVRLATDSPTPEEMQRYLSEIKD